jgi:hypothetical protein
MIGHSINDIYFGDGSKTPPMMKLFVYKGILNVMCSMSHPYAGMLQVFAEQNGLACVPCLGDPSTFCVEGDYTELPEGEI